ANTIGSQALISIMYRSRQDITACRSVWLERRPVMQATAISASSKNILIICAFYKAVLTYLARAYWRFISPINNLSPRLGYVSLVLTHNIGDNIQRSGH